MPFDVGQQRRSHLLNDDLRHALPKINRATCLVGSEKLDQVIHQMARCYGGARGDSRSHHFLKKSLFAFSYTRDCKTKMQTTGLQLAQLPNTERSYER